MGPIHGNWTRQGWLIVTAVYTELRLPPGPRGRPLLGSTFDIARAPLETVLAGWRQYGDVVRYRVGNRYFCVVSHPDLAQEVLQNTKDRFLKPYRRDGKPVGLQMLLGNGLLTNADHDSWLRQRRMMQPMFHRRQVGVMAETMTAMGERMLARWEQEVGVGGEVDLSFEMMRVTMDIITRTMFSAEVGGDAGKIGPAIVTAAEFASQHARHPFHAPLSWPTPANRRFREAMALVTDLVEGLIDERRAHPEVHGDLLDMLLTARDEETGEGMTDKQLQNEVATIFAAGHETTANALTWTWYALSRNPHVLRRLQEEVDEVLGGRAPTVADVPALSYTERVFQEALRLYPPAPLVPRVVPVDEVLGGYKMPARTLLTVSILNIHRHPDFWPDPETFDPDRFTPENSHGRHRFAFMPFGGGPRLCIGNNFAMMEGTLLLALMAQHYELRLKPGHPVAFKFAVTLRPRYGMRMTLHPRRPAS